MIQIDAGAILDIAMAWAWCGIMAWAKLISAWLWSWATDGALVAVPEGAVLKSGTTPAPQGHHWAESWQGERP